jgi:hypothetical protein
MAVGEPHFLPDPILACLETCFEKRRRSRYRFGATELLPRWCSGKSRRRREPHVRILRQKYRGVRLGLSLAITATAILTLALVSPGLANLAGSTFEGNDGNLVVNTGGNHDWGNAPNRVRGDDLPSGTQDNSFGQGTKEDDANVSVVTGSIPPNKSNLTRFYVANEFASNSNFLYLAWERSNVLGSANMDFEINQQNQPNLTTTGPKTLNRTAGDLLITFDFTNGGGNPVLGLLTWVTTGPASQCFSANALPCWGNRVNLSAAGFAEGAVNTVTVTDPIANVSLPGLTFGEAAVNLTAAGVFPAGTCKAFGSAFLKSRSSASFPAEVKDFVAPQPVNISNCGTIIIKKVTQPSPDPTDTSFAFTLTGGPSSLNKSFSLKNGGVEETKNLLVGSGYSAAETVPANWQLVSATCDDGSPVTNIDLSPDETVTCTFTNHTNLSPRISTALSLSSITVGGTIHDSATLTGATSDAGGTVTYTVYTDSACTQGAQPAGTKTVTNGVVPDSNPITFNSAGDFYWQAVYSGDANNDGATSDCTSEHLIVTKANPSIATAQNLLPNDNASLTGLATNAGGTITFNLYDPADATCSGAPAYTQTVNVNGNGLYSTTNTSFYAIDEGTWRWQVTYSGDDNNTGSTSACGVERFTIANK